MLFPIGNGQLIFPVSASAQFSPDSVPGLNVWLDPSDAATVHLILTGVSVIDNKVVNLLGNYGQLDPSARMTIGTMNGINCLRGNGTQFLGGTGLAGFLPEGELFIVNKYNAVSVDGSGNGLCNFGAGPAGAHPFSNNLYYDNFGSDTQKTNIIPIAINTNPRVWNTISIPNEWTAYENNTQVFTTNINTVAFGNSLIGTSGNGSFFWNGDIGEVLIYNRKLTNDERDDVYGYLQSKWL